ncbi:MAG: NAD(P)-dependent oxidoreductase [Chlamydiales bacterium]
MPSILLQEPLLPEEVTSLKMEFPHYEILTECENDSDWDSIEILYGQCLTEQQLKLAPRLRWIHCPTTAIEELCLTEIQKTQNILVTLSKGQNVPQIAEYVIGAILAFAKQLFHWPQAPHDPAEFWDWPLKETMWMMQKKILLQIGLGEVGTAIVKMANDLGMKSWGVRRHLSFHPYCHKTYPLSNIHSLLPAADVVVLALPKRALEQTLFGEEEFELMKSDSIFIVVGSGDPIDETALAKVAKTGKFRGILLDAFRHPPPAKNSPLWDMPNGILTPSAASFPEAEEHLPFRLFLRNLRMFSTGQINEMKNLMIRV